MNTYVGYMIYSLEEGKKNRKFVDLFKKNGKNHGLEFRVVPREQYLQEPIPDFVINRTRDKDVSAFYEKQGIPVFHPKEIVEIGNHKWKTIQKIQQSWRAEIPLYIPETMYVSNTSDLQPDVLYQQVISWIEKWWEDASGRKRECVIKTVDGHGGQEVFLVTKDTVCALAEHIIKFVQTKEWNREFLLQEKISCERRDIRVYILGGRIYAAVLRQGQQDFRSNYSLGGTVLPYTLTKQQKVYVDACIQSLGGDALSMVGIDFFPVEGEKLVFNELEEMVGCRMLYACTETDIVKDYTEWLSSYLRKSIV